MGIEVADFLSGLNPNWPLDTDSGTQGDDHLRLIKSVLRSTFPGASGNGFSKQIIATEDELNSLAAGGSLPTAIAQLQADLLALQNTLLTLTDGDFNNPPGAQDFFQLPSALGGFIIQWGNNEVPPNMVSFEVALPRPWTLTYLQSVISALGSASPQGFGSDGSILNPLTHITLYNTYSTAQNARWIAIGK